jgi:hypothetical protein
MVKLFIMVLAVLGAYVAFSNMDFFHTEAFTVGRYSVQVLALALVAVAFLVHKYTK